MDTPFGGRPFLNSTIKTSIQKKPWNIARIFQRDNERAKQPSLNSNSLEVTLPFVPDKGAVATIFRAVQRNYPVMTLEEFRGGLEWKGGAQRLFDYVNAQNGMDGKGDGTASEDPPTPAAVAASA